MKLFNNKINEQVAIDYLKKYDSRYKNLIKSEQPDFISEKDSIGVEVTVVEFDEFIDSFKYKDKTIIEYIRMKGIKAIQKGEFACFKKLLNYNRSIYEEFIKKEIIDKYYYKKGDSILELQSIEEYVKLDPSTNLYPKDLFPEKMSLKEQKITSFLPSAFWMEKITDKYIEAVKLKNKKLSNYRKFEENSLVLVNFTGEKEETVEFEKQIKEIEGINFDKIFILNLLFGNEIYEIDLRK